MKENKFIYFDNAATTLPYDDVVVLHNELTKKHFANANSIHALGRDSAKYLASAKEKILKAFDLPTYKVIFTSGATEANNLAIKGSTFHYQSRGNHIITTKIEHPSVLEAFRQLETKYGFKVTYLSVDEKGLINLEELKAAMNDLTLLVSVMAVNNEVGVIEPISEISKIVHSYPKALLHVDMTQAIGKESFNYKDIDLITFSGHKIHGLKGTGALVSRGNISFDPLLSGGDQEYGYRSGTSDVAGACALAKAVEKAFASQKKNYDYVSSLKNRLVDSLNGEDIVFNSNENCSPYIVNFSLKNKKASVVVEALSLEGIYVSSVSACNSKKEPESYVVKAMFNDLSRAKNTVRVSFSEFNTLEEVDEFASTFKKIMRSIR